MINIPETKHLVPYFKLAEEEAHKSPCVRRQYGAVIGINTDPELMWYFKGHNERVSSCCNGMCVRDRVNTKHGGNVEIGGEIHAETSVLITSTESEGHHNTFILVGFENGKELLGNNVYPCHSCAMQIKFAGFSHIYIRNKRNEIVPVSISEIIEYRISEWEPVE